MAVNASNKAISLLDALDQSFAPPGSPLSEGSGTPLKRNHLQTPNLKHYFESGTSSSSKVRILDNLRAAQKVQDSRLSDPGRPEFMLAGWLTKRHCRRRCHGLIDQRVALWTAQNCRSGWISSQLRSRNPPSPNRLRRT